MSTAVGRDGDRVMLMKSLGWTYPFKLMTKVDRLQDPRGIVERGLRYVFIMMLHRM